MVSNKEIANRFYGLLSSGLIRRKKVANELIKARDIIEKLPYNLYSRYLANSARLPEELNFGDDNLKSLIEQTILDPSLNERISYDSARNEVLGMISNQWRARR